MSNSEIFSKYIFNACVEIRFKEILEKDRFHFYLSLFSEKYPNVVFHKNITINLIGNLSQVEFAFEGDQVSISFGKGIILIEVLNYKSWEDFFSIVKNDLERIQNGGIKVDGVERAGMRFVRMLPKVETLSAGINGGLDVKLGEDFSSLTEVIRNQYVNSSEDAGATIQTAKGLPIGIKGKEGFVNQEGLYIDIDVYKTDPAKSFDEDLFNNINLLYGMQSSAFASLIKDHYVSTLNA